MSIFSRVKSAVSSTYKKVDRAVGGRLPGGVPSKSSSSSSSSSSTSSSSSSVPTSLGGTQSSNPFSGGSSSSSGGDGGRSYQGPVQPGVSESTFRSTGRSVPAGGVAGGQSIGGGANLPGTITSSQKNQQVALDSGVTSPPPLNTVSSYKPPSFRDIPRYVSANIKNKGVYETVKGVGGLVYGVVSGYTLNQWNKLSEKDKREAFIKQEQKNLQEGVRERSFTQSGRGTVVKENIPYTNEEIVNLAEQGGVSDKAALNELSRREEEKYGIESNAFIKSSSNRLQEEGKKEYGQEYENVQQKVSQKQQELQNKVNSGVITFNQANEQLESYIKDRNKYLESRAGVIDKNINNQLKTEYQQWLETRGATLNKDSNVYLNKVSDKIKISKTLRVLPLIVGAGFVTGGALTTIASTSALAEGAVAYGGAVAGTVTSTTTGGYLYQSYKQGTLSSARVAATLIPLVAFGAGATVGSGVASSVIARNNQIKLTSALDRANIEGKYGKGVTSEAQIARLNIPEAQKAELISQLQQGASIKEIKYNINPKNSIDAKVINKNLPSPNIKFIEVTNTQGNVINRVAVGKINTGGGGSAFKEDVLSVGRGRFDPKTGTSKVSSLNLELRDGKLVAAQKTTSVSKGSVTEIEGGRIITSKGVAGSTERIVAQKNKPITAKDLTNLAEKQINKANIKVKAGELQEYAKTDTLVIEAIKGGDAELLAGVEKFYLTRGGGIKTEKIVDPLKYTRGAIDKSIKGFGAKDLGIKVDNIQKSNVPNINNQVLESSTKNILDAKNIPSGDYSQTVSNALKDIKVNKNFGITLVGDIGLKDLNKEITIESTFPKLNIGQQEKFVEKQKIKSISTTTNLPKVSELSYTQENVATAIAQSQKQIQKLKAPIKQVPVTKAPTIPSITVPNINVPKFIPPPLPTFPQPSGSQKKLKRLTTKRKIKIPKYSASLVAAAFQAKPLTITKEMYKKLARRTYSGLEARPVLAVIDEEDLKKKVKAVKF